jgi:2-oxoacid:acceptor oxidoreductase gamma subunit (pyruvate/2-ketoisovalerate family)/2-oxoacid:acceptor oxidoreductase delta subunit (pyruvate/2-ketoisovalerate family)
MSSRMTEMLLVGRGGEGVVLASQVLADTLARAGFWVQSFPEFKAERRGAPISAFLRWDEEPIHRRFKLDDCDVLAVVSPSPPPAQALARVRPGGLVVLNRETRFPHTDAFAIARVPASRIARDHGILSAEARPMGNIALLGALVKLLLPDGLEHLEQAIAARMGAGAEPNVLAAREGFARCTRQHAVATDTPVERPASVATRPLAHVFSVSTTDSLQNLTGAWSLDRPVLLDACNDCALCALFCPEGAIARVDGSMVVDYLYCKGCGICEAVCPVRNAIAMEEVPA